jgi:hypothetical protein
MKEQPMKRIISPLIVLAATQLLAACGPATEEEGLLPEAETLESQTQALYESCTSSAVSLAQPDGAAVTFQFPHCSYGDSAATSVDGSYDQTLCPNKFVTEVQQVNGLWFEPFVEAVPASTITTESACEGIAIAGYAWGFTSRTNTWTSLGTVSTAGIWHPASCSGMFCFPAYCQLRFAFPAVSGGYSKVRVAGVAAALGIFKGRVRTGVWSGPGPC